jgi:hypothetical protein
VQRLGSVVRGSPKRHLALLPPVSQTGRRVVVDVKALGAGEKAEMKKAGAEAARKMEAAK